MKFLITSLILAQITSTTSTDDENLYGFLQTEKKQLRQQRMKQKTQNKQPELEPYSIEKSPNKHGLHGAIEIPLNETSTFSFEVIYPDSLAPSMAPTSSSELDFNYDPDSPLGPDNWDTVTTIPITYKDFIVQDENQCSSTNNDHVQSPINVHHNYICADKHPPKLSYGQTKFSELEFAILPSTLRVNFPRNNIPPPKIDFSELSTPIKLLNIDIKIKSEHYLNGQQYPGEFQMYFHFPKTSDEHKENKEDELVALAIFMDFDEKDEDNVQLEQFIRQWEEKMWKRQNECERKKDPSVAEYAPRYYNVYRKNVMEEIWDLPKVANSTMRTDFNVWRFMPTGYYCGYEGSLTTPPCTEKVTWRLLDLPMKMSSSQYERMQSILTNRLDTRTCEITTAAYNGTVNRPLQQETQGFISNGQKMFCCNAYNWPFSDENDPRYWLESWPLDYHGWQGTTVATYKSFFNLGGVR